MKMSFHNKFKSTMLLLSASLLYSTGSKADEYSDLANSGYLFVDYGLATYKSLLVESNDTMGVVTYGLGAHAGEEKELGIEYRVENATTAFVLNQSSIKTTWTSTIIKYRLWAFELGAVIGQSKILASRESEEILDVVGNGYGGYFGMLFPVGKSSLIYLNAMSVSNAEVIDKKERTITLGSRLDAEIGSRVSITKKALDFTLGYRRRSNSISEDGISYAELQTSTFIGFHTGFDF